MTRGWPVWPVCHRMASSGLLARLLAGHAARGPAASCCAGSARLFSSSEGQSDGASRRHGERRLNGPSLGDFLKDAGGKSGSQTAASGVGHLDFVSGAGGGDAVEHEAGKPGGTEQQRWKFFVETYGCQMNQSDTEIVRSILQSSGHAPATTPDDADIILLNTCAIRDNAEQRIWGRLGAYKGVRRKRAEALRDHRRAGGSPATAPRAPPTVGILGCMAERLKSKLLEGEERVADVIAGPDAYRDLPRLIDVVRGGPGGGPLGAAGPGAMNVQLSLEETYADVLPSREGGWPSAFSSIMRGCNNMCSFCIVPFTRGRERSRPVDSILAEVEQLSQAGYKEVTLLGQNVNSYADVSGAAAPGSSPRPGRAEEAADPFAGVYARGFRSVYKPRRDGATTFAQLLDLVAQVDPEMRVRFTSPHPKDFSDDVLSVIASRANVCKLLHMPAQSGSSRMLERMKRGHSREAYDDLVAHARAAIPGVALSTDIIVGFCGETAADHADTMDLLRTHRYDQGYLFAYSRRDKTHAARHYEDDVPEHVKAERLREAIGAFREALAARCGEEHGRVHLVLVDGFAKKPAGCLMGRTCTNRRVVLRGWEGVGEYGGAAGGVCDAAPGMYVAAEIEGSGVGGSAGNLYGRVLGRTTLQEFVGRHGAAWAEGSSAAGLAAEVPWGQERWLEALAAATG
ncbi:unnamed protein product [Pedinophyceae sp. YPF-701]|nr:unnamed protein product [Pedinophyceae sp. YPF-701]